MQPVGYEQLNAKSRPTVSPSSLILGCRLVRPSSFASVPVRATSLLCTLSSSKVENKRSGKKMK